MVKRKDFSATLKQLTDCLEPETEEITSERATHPVTAIRMFPDPLARLVPDYSLLQLARSPVPPRKGTVSNDSIKAL